MSTSGPRSTPTSSSSAQASKLLATTSKNGQTRRFFLFTHPRTASNLLLRILNLDAQTKLMDGSKKGYFFTGSMAMKFFSLGDQPLHCWSREQRNKMMDQFQRDFESLKDHVLEAEAKGSDVLIKEHAVWLTEPVSEAEWLFGDAAIMESPWRVDIHGHGSPHTESQSKLNKTIIPDEYLRAWLPTILVRHPALVFPSLYRTGTDSQGIEATRRDPAHKFEMSLRWLRLLYDFFIDEYINANHSTYASRGETWPIVLDADDIMNNPSVIHRYCEILGLNSSNVQYRWDSARGMELSEMCSAERRMQSTLLESTGIVNGKTADNIDVDKAADTWKVEFGEEEDMKLKAWVLAAMPDYQYLRERRLVPVVEEGGEVAL